MAVDWYEHNPLTNRDRRLSKADSAWVRSFACEDVRPLIVCRGPVRKEALDVFAQMGITHAGVLLSEKDSIIYRNALAPELRQLDPKHVHRVKDYTGATKEERVERIRQIIRIARDHGYDSVFAGYGFMAEDESFVAALEEAGLRFLGPGSHTVRAAGFKDEAKRTAVKERVSVTPGVDDATARALLAKHPDADALRAVAKEHALDVPDALFEELAGDLPSLADRVLEASYDAGVDLYTIDELAAQVVRDVATMLAEHPGSRVRLKAIGGGGGKGQRIVPAVDPEGDGPVGERAAKAAEAAAGMVREILSEVKATGVGDNKNVLIELNVEQTRHHEIQLLGNGEWCVSMGGRDCSLQMHEQKLLEISVTQEALREAVAEAREAGDDAVADALEEDLHTLCRMEEEGERFGRAVGLDSASTFECIVEGASHYFMEVNTRIQVEHRVSELCYALRFENPDDATDRFEVDSIVEAMVLLARHGERLPRPTRVRRKTAALEARLNATDRALHPHAGGLIVSWSPPIEDEIRDDQGICQVNPDTGLFMRYRLAGAYDSNVALLVTHGEDRRDSYARLAEILRRMRIRGYDLSTNHEFHRGLVEWFLRRSPWAKPTTRFVVPYLTQVGLLKEIANELDVAHAWGLIGRHHQRRWGDAAAAQEALERKMTLLKRPLDRMFEEPHLASAWLSRNRGRYRFEDGRLRWLANPVEVLADTYALLDMTYDERAPAALVIWDHDHELVETALGFYQRLGERLGDLDYPALDARLAEAAPPEGFDEATWRRVRASHAGFQIGVEILGLLATLGEEARFEELRVEDDLTVTIPERLLDPALQERMRKVLVPPPATKANEIVAVSGGMFYAQEAPDRPPLVREGDHFDEGDPLYVIEVMKMFNKVRAPFAGTVDKVLVERDGEIVRKGQPLFEITPDERFVEEDPKERKRRSRERTEAHVRRVLPG
ncbi:MAG TPA: biotin/lipoyl-containing protein [Sandaracinaceae bacterium LLY-WYZ-13_1]|nr:biotin/lipoyl-containing protein [Sandaracinaceae bacterium LLY-WYZ-13_1]